MATAATRRLGEDANFEDQLDGEKAQAAFSG